MPVQEINTLVDWFKANVFNAPEIDDEMEQLDTSDEDTRPNIIGEKDYIEEPGLLEYIIGVD